MTLPHRLTTWPRMKNMASGALYPRRVGVASGAPPGCHGCTCRWLKGELPPWGHHPGPADSEGSKADVHSWGALRSWVRPSRVKGRC